MGHAVGDRVLQQVAEELRKGLRSSDEVCRWGGEEFVLIAPCTDAEGAVQLAEKTRAAVESAMRSGRVPVTISLGVAVSHGNRPDVQSLLQRADAALFRAKRQGRNRVVEAVLED